MLTSCKFHRLNDSESVWYCKDTIGEFTVKCSTSHNWFNITNNENIEDVTLHDQKVDYFPRGFGSFFPDLKRLTISHCGLISVSRDDLISLEKLEHLAVTSNLLTSLPNDLFIGMTRLKSISFEDNQLENMSSHLLKPLLKNGPTLIDFRGNSKIDEVYNSKIPEGISLQHLMDQIDTKCDKPAEEHGLVSIVESFKDDLISGLAELWKSGEHSDFTIIANGSKEFRVHKNVLAIRSSVFATMFKSNMKEQQTGKMLVSDFSAEAVEQFFACLYTGKIEDVSYAMELFALAAMYDIPRLKAACEENVLQNIDSSNVCDAFSLGHLHSSSALQRKAYDAIKKILPGIEFDEGSIDVQRMKVLIDADNNRKRKIQEAEDEFKSICMNSK